MREDLERLLPALHPNDAKTLRKTSFMQRYGHLAESLPESESYIAILPVVYGRGQAVLGLTKDKLICRQQFDDNFMLPLRQIDGVRSTTVGMWRPKPLRLEIHLGSGMIDIGLTVETQSADHFVAALESAVAGAGTSPSAPSPAGSVADELVKLAALRDQGVLTDDEFEVQKAQLLA